jgi:hypothetical protein
LGCIIEAFAVDVNGVQVTTGVLWRGAILFAVIALVLLFVTVSFVSPTRFRLLRRYIVMTTFAVWFIIWLAMASLLYWGSVYSYFFPAWSRWLLPTFMGLGFSAASLAFWHLACKAKNWSVTVFVLLGGLLGPATHTWAVIRGIVTKPPMLKGASPLAAIIISLPEFAIYFIVITWLAVLARWMVEGGRRHRIVGS